MRERRQVRQKKNMKIQKIDQKWRFKKCANMKTEIHKKKKQEMKRVNIKINHQKKNAKTNET